MSLNVHDKIDLTPSVEETTKHFIDSIKACRLPLAAWAKAFVFAESLNRSGKNFVGEAFYETLSYKFLVLLTILVQLSLHRLQQI